MEWIIVLAGIVGLFVWLYFKPMYCEVCDECNTPLEHGLCPLCNEVN